MDGRAPVIQVWAKLDAPSAQIPTQGYAGDAGFDLYTSRSVMVQPGGFVDVHTDISIAMPSTVWGLLVPRSSAARKIGLRVETGIIDPGYRGELFVGVWNPGHTPIHLVEGQRLAQFIPVLRVGVEWRETDLLPDSDRGGQGFGSTGK